MWQATKSVQKWSKTVTHGSCSTQTKAEQAAWEVAKEHGLDVVTILPNFVLGPVISDRIDGLSALFIKVCCDEHDNTCAAIGHVQPPLQGWLEGVGSTGDLTICDVRDVARAHIAAVETPSASGRYIISDSHCISSKFVADTFKVSLHCHAR